MINGEKVLDHPIRWAMVGGGRGSQIGYIHRSAALRDRSFELVAGAFDINPERGKDFGIQLGVNPDRCYPDYKTMLAEEAKRGDDKIEAVTIAVPNGLHYEVCKAVLEAGFHAVCEKPLCFTTEQAEELVHLADSKGLVVGVTYGYSGHQLIEQARQMVLHGDLGEIRLVKMQFPFGAYNTPVEETNSAARWRMDPTKAGPSFVLGDVGTHPLFLAETMVPDFEIESLMCTTKSFIPTRKLEDNAFVIMNLKGGAQATCWASAINCGALHGQKVRIVGSKASVEWYDERPNQLTYEIEGEPVRILERGGAYLYPSARAEDRISGGHTEGLFDAWSNLYRRFAIANGEGEQGREGRLLVSGCPCRCGRRQVGREMRGVGQEGRCLGQVLSSPEFQL